MLDTHPRSLADITARVAGVVARSEISTGLCTLFLRHTSASLLIQENADPSVLSDLARWIARLAPESSAWEHVDEGPDDMPGHLRAAILRTSESVPIANRHLLLGVWQAIYLFEHRARGRPREIVVHVFGL